MQNTYPLWQKTLAEFVGTFALVWVGTGAIVVNNATGGGVTHAGISLAFGGIVTAMILCFGAVSGAHINPCVSLAFWLSGRFAGKQLLPFLVAQFTGGILASLALGLAFPEDPFLGATLPAGAAWQSFLLEIGLSFFLMWVILHFATGAKEIGKYAAWAIGGTVLLEAYFAGPITGASMNPARSLGPALVSGHLEHLWVYLAAPFLGAGLAVLACRGLKGADCCSISCSCEVDKPAST